MTTITKKEEEVYGAILDKYLHGRETEEAVKVYKQMMLRDYREALKFQLYCTRIRPDLLDLSIKFCSFALNKLSGNASLNGKH